MTIFKTSFQAIAISALFAISGGSASLAQGLGCNIDLRLRNDAGVAVDAHIRTFQVRSRVGGTNGFWGPWRRVQNSGWQPQAVDLRIQPGARARGTYHTSLLCEDLRQYRVEFTCRAGSRSNLRFDASHRSTRDQSVVVGIGYQCG